MPELFRSICERQMELGKMKLICCMLYLLHSVVLLDGFQWSHRQQASHVISVEAGSDVSLPCEYELTPQEQQEADVFHLLTWTREEPHFSDRWTGLAINSTLSQSKVIYDDPQRIFIVDGTLTVKNITVKDRTRYQCAFQSSFFTTPSIINLDVKYPPEIMLKPLSQDIIEGNDVRLLCNASGNPQPNITWMRQGNSDVLSSSETLLLRNLVSEDDGSVYTCRVENYLGLKQTSVTITIQYPPEIMLKPLSQDIIEGNDVRLLCNASGNPQPNITWIRQGNSDVLSSSETLLLRNLVREDDGSVYTCRVENYLGLKQASVTITIQYPPEIMLKPLSQDIIEGNDVRLLCNASGNPQPNITWMRQGNSDVLSSSETLLLRNLVSEDDGSVYTCRVENYLGLKQASVTITIQYPPEIMLKPLSQDIIEGNDVRLLCNASGNPPPKITWTRQGNSDVLSSSETLLLRNLVSEDDGSVYTCRVENYLGLKQASVTITIQYPPEIMLKPLSQDIIEGNDVRLLCNASGNPPPKITWTRQGNSDVLSSSETLLLRNLVSEDDGSVYTCRVENYLGLKQASITITIQYKPKDTRVTISSGEVKLGDRVDITCWARANPSPEYKFYYNNKLIRWSSKGLLSLMNVNTEDQGTYQCVPVNYLGDGSGASVTVTLSTGDKAFPVWVYAAIASGVLFLLLIAAGIALCRARKKWKAADDRTTTTQPIESTISRHREAHVGPGDFYGDHNGSIEIPHLNGALSFSDIRSSQEMPTIRGALSENNLRIGEAAGLKNTLSDDKSMGQGQKKQSPSYNIGKGKFHTDSRREYFAYSG
ncbi:hemicentin-1-like isoform X4 [Acropora palmata]|uniref:hemicentin-1-like isoform X4 n=1 Tax=Acropora palmata TaxID=6131 RepID=UPI003DA09C6C